MEPSLPRIPDTADARRPLVMEALAEIEAADPGFDLHQFLERVKTEFFVIKQALGAHVPSQVAGYATPAILQTWRNAAATAEARGVRLEWENLQIDDIRLMWVALGPAGHQITVGIDAAASTRGVSVHTGALVFGGRGHQPFTEYWTLTRPAVARTAIGESDAGGCPKCGAPLGTAIGALCPFCGIILPTSLQGWVIARIDERLEWTEAGL